MGSGDVYMTAVSPWFFVHYNSDRNFVLDGDHWLYVNRWLDIYNHRSQVDAVEVVTWNGEVILVVTRATR